MKINKRRFSILIDRVNAVKKEKMPIVKYLDYIENTKEKDVAFTHYEYPTQMNPKAILIFIHENGDFGFNMGHFFRRFAH